MVVSIIRERISSAENGTTKENQKERSETIDRVIAKIYNFTLDEIQFNSCLPID